MLLGDGVDGIEDVPVDEASARRGSESSLVNPSVVSVDHVHQVPEVKHGDERVTVVREVKRLEEGVNDGLLGICQLSVEVIN